jgi:hypothetical protein
MLVARPHSKNAFLHYQEKNNYDLLNKNAEWKEVVLTHPSEV